MIRAPLDATLPLDPGHATVVFAPLTETERAAFWRVALARRGLVARDVDALAARWRIGPGVIEDVIAQATGAAELDAALDQVARQHVAARLAHLATPVRRLATWNTVALPEDVVDSVRELIGRIAQRRTVLEQWGFDATTPSARTT